jgi:hypothetical protein
MRSKCGPLALVILLVCAINGLAQTQSRNDGPTTPTPTAVPTVPTVTTTETKATPHEAADRAATGSSATSVTEAGESAPAEVKKVTGVPTANATTAANGATVAARTRSEDADSEMAKPPKSSSATPAANPDGWRFQVAPYFWLASLHGDTGVLNRSAQVDESFGDIWGSLKFAMLGVFTARKGRFLLFADTEYISIEDDKATPGPLFSNVNAKFKTFIFNPEVGYTLYQDADKAATVDVTGGIRVWHVSTDLAFGAGILPAVEVQGSRNWVDAIVGIRGKTAVSEKLFVTGDFDLGGGGSKFTWELFGGLGYNIKPNIALVGGYRVLDVDYNKNNFLYDMNQRGPLVGLAFRF